MRLMVDECEDSSICQGNCTNTIGSYKCDCLEGFYNVNDILCSDIDECIVDNGNCTHNCTNSLGSYECSCLPGFLKLGFTECSLTDECNTNNGGCHQNCTNSIDGYVCSCFEGFKVSSLNSSHCDKDPNAGTGEQNANSKGPEFYVLFFLCFIFLVTIILLFVFLIVVFLYFRREIQLLKSTPASKVLSLPELDNNKLKESLRMSPIQESDNIKMNYGAKETEEKDLPLSDYPQV